jgi:hypothetical protein
LRPHSKLIPIDFCATGRTSAPHFASAKREKPAIIHVGDSYQDLGAIIVAPENGGGKVCHGSGGIVRLRAA